MNGSLLIFFITGIALCLCYCFVILRSLVGWTKLKSVRVLHDSVSVSVIIAARNEEQNIQACLDSLMAQSYPASKFEVIVVDDHSEDRTKEVAELTGKKYPNVKVMSLSADLSGKKNAIAAGIGISRGDLIVTTDADCMMKEDWLKCMVSAYVESGSEMIAGPVAFHNEDTLFKKMQSLEFMALIASGAGALYYQKAVMCNGANLAYSRKAFERAGGFEGTAGKASGDDVLLMYRLNELFPGKVSFLKDERAIVSTAAKSSLSGFLQQRRRWASKGFHALNAETRFTALSVYFFCLFILVCPLADWFCYHNSSFYLVLTGFCLILMGIKCLIDFLLLFLTASFFGKERFLLLFLPEQVVYLVYIVFTGLMGSWGKYEWKGRKTN